MDPLRTPLTWLLSPVLVAQALATRRRVPVLPEALGPREGRFGDGESPWRILIAGDSSAAGVGVDHQDQAFAGQFIRALYRRRPLPLSWSLRARSGLTTQQLHDWLRAEPAPTADVAVVLSGVNDLIDRVPVRRALSHRAALAHWLLDTAGARAVVFAPLPPVDQFPALPWPLRQVMGAQARRHDQALREWAGVQRHVYYAPVDIKLTRQDMAADGFHPGRPVYAHVGESLAGFVADNVRL